VSPNEFRPERWRSPHNLAIFPSVIVLILVFFLVCDQERRSPITQLHPLASFGRLRVRMRGFLQGNRRLGCGDPRELFSASACASSRVIQTTSYVVPCNLVCVFLGHFPPFGVRVQALIPEPEEGLCFGG